MHYVPVLRRALPLLTGGRPRTGSSNVLHGDQDASRAAERLPARFGGYFRPMGIHLLRGLMPAAHLDPVPALA
jgi:hypothetical protein